MKKTEKLSSVCERLALSEKVRYYVDGERVSKSVAMKMFEESSNYYMADFDFGKEGKISEVRLNRIDLT